MEETESTQLDEHEHTNRGDRYSAGTEPGAVRRAGRVHFRVSGFSEKVVLIQRSGGFAKGRE